ncbi:bifunctional phosphoribosyl-AMP cyclohydrolase/phosphoribosyl-ATP diphosphatase HisIE [Bacillus sp. 2205SS5-2]|uniref:bifunctional phosphoribosyl-AMP cyclohydrolase/phosphoribosyl-ATP diphosphatase HisIE n=1 Tax=Bacillus sp. 2205SS5-2 TaxID=3109031 RepID=UPI003004B93F
MKIDSDFVKDIVFDEKGLVPAIVQDAKTKEVLTLAYMSKESLRRSIDSGETWFYSRSRAELWHKGASSGNTQSIVELRFDCDKDAILALVKPEGPACHTGEVSCFTPSFYQRDECEGEQPEENNILETLQQLISEREQNMPAGAYTTYLFSEGLDKILKKVGEESAEVIIAAKNRDKEELTWETADLLYHLLVLLQEQKLPFQDVLNVLAERQKK